MRQSLLKRFFARLRMTHGAQAKACDYHLLRMTYTLGMTMCLLLVTWGICNAGTGVAGGKVLLLEPAARQAGIGGVGCALEPDVNSCAWNPALLSEINGQEASFLYSMWLMDTSYQWLAYARPLRIGTMPLGVSASILRFGAGNIAGYDWYDTPIGTVTAGNFSGSISAGSSLNLGRGVFGFGITARLMNERLVDDSATSISFDAGATYRIPHRRIRTGLSCCNFGSGLKFIEKSSKLPTELNAGVSFQPIPDYLNLSCDLTTREGEFIIAGGAEYWLFGKIALRAGWTTENSIGSGLRAGLGLHIKDIQVDYAWSDYQEFGASHRIGIIARFGKLSLEEVMYRRALKLWKAGDSDGALLELNKLLAINPNHWPAKRAKTNILQESPDR